MRWKGITGIMSGVAFRIESRTLQPREAKHGRLDVDVLNVKQINVERAHRHTEHDFGRQLDKVDTESFRHEREGARGSAKEEKDDGLFEKKRLEEKTYELSQT